jgi:segregation and condensation protein B
MAPDDHLPSPPGAPEDPSQPDLGQPDLGQPDLGQPDLGQPDLGHLDLGHLDLGHLDHLADRFREQRRAIEAVLMVADAPVEPGMLAQLLEVAPAQVEALCYELDQSYRREQRGFVLVKVAGGYRFQSHPDLAPYIERFVLEGQTARLSAAALETLAIVAYKQPISRAQVAAIRGVNADAVLRTLCHRGYVCEVARDPGPGQAVLYGTSPLLLERLGLDKIEDLPPLGDFVPGPEIMDALEQGLRSG